MDIWMAGGVGERWGGSGESGEGVGEWREGRRKGKSREEGKGRGEEEGLMDVSRRSWRKRKKGKEQIFY
jgi:hypothetical protein